MKISHAVWVAEDGEYKIPPALWARVKLLLRKDGNFDKRRKAGAIAAVEKRLLSVKAAHKAKLRGVLHEWQTDVMFAASQNNSLRSARKRRIKPRKD